MHDKTRHIKYTSLFLLFFLFSCLYTFLAHTLIYNMQVIGRTESTFFFFKVQTGSFSFSNFQHWLNSIFKARIFFVFVERDCWHVCHLEELLQNSVSFLLVQYLKGTNARQHCIVYLRLYHCSNQSCHALDCVRKD